LRVGDLALTGAQTNAGFTRVKAAVLSRGMQVDVNQFPVLSRALALPSGSLGSLIKEERASAVYEFMQFVSEKSLLFGDAADDLKEIRAAYGSEFSPRLLSQVSEFYDALEAGRRAIPQERYSVISESMDRMKRVLLGNPSGEETIDREFDA